MKIILSSCGKSQILSEQANLYLDCRIIWNPYRDPTLGGLTGDHSKVQEWLEQENAGVISLFMGLIEQGIKTLPTRDGGHRDPSKPFKITCFCLAGIHRSRGMKHVLAKRLKALGYEVEVI